MNNRTPEQWCSALLGSVITAIEISEDASSVKITLSTGIVEFEGEDFDMYVELNKDKYQ